MKLMLKCPDCGAELKLSIGFSGCDWNCEAGKGSGYDWEVSLQCTNKSCACVFTLGNVKNYNDFSFVIDKYKNYRR